MPQENANTQNIHAQIQELRHANSIILLRLSQLEVIVHNITNNMPALEGDSEQDTDDELDTDNHHDFTNHGLFASHVNFVII